MRRRSAFTLIELLVVIAIIAILIGLLVPAVQKVRAAAARAQCSNNLKQIGLAAHSYHDANKKLPPGSGTLAVGASSAPSTLALILPYLEQANLYNQFNFTVDVNNTAANAVARDQDVPVYLCPSDGSSATVNDPGGSGLPAGRSNYFGNVGTTADQRSTDMSRAGIFNFTYSAATTPATPRLVTNKVRLTDISDGSSNTCMFAETTRSMVSSGNNYDKTMVYILPTSDDGWSVASPQVGTLYNETNASAWFTGNTYKCNSWDYGPTNIIRYRGLEYYRALPQTNHYTHTVPPNYNGYDCGDSSFTMAHIAARSYHTGGVNVCFADGSVHFISDGITFTTWQALGTRAANDIVDGSQIG
jgi:prepilin-type N-terminal cleavage/methylation domain-containing protein/prepilin-type processing-associated H-X9-DG protein